MSETHDVVSHSEDLDPVVADHGTVYIAGAIYKLEHNKGHYEVTQVEAQDHFAAAPPPGPDYKPFDITIGPVRLRGYYNVKTLSIVVTIYVLGVKLGEVSGNLKDGIEFKIDIFLAKGSIRFFTKTGTDVWVHVKVKVTGFPEFDKEVKIFPR